MNVKLNQRRLSLISRWRDPVYNSFFRKTEVQKYLWREGRLILKWRSSKRFYHFFRWDLYQNSPFNIYIFIFTQRRVLCIYTFSFCQFFRKRLNPHKTKFLLYGEKMKFSICRDPLSFSFLCKRVGKLGAYERLPYKYLISPFANEI